MEPSSKKVYVIFNFVLCDFLKFPVVGIPLTSDSHFIVYIMYMCV